MLTTDNVKLIDFGLSSQPHEYDVTKGAGSHLYMSPEVYDNNLSEENMPLETLKKPHIWSAGVSMYRFVNGHFPYCDNEESLLRVNICVQDEMKKKT